MSADANEEIKWIYSLVEKHFPIYESKVDANSITLYVNPKDRSTVSAEFSEIQKELKNKGFIAAFDYTRGEYILLVLRGPAPQQKSKKKTLLNKVLLVLTFITTTIAGMVLWSGYDSSSGMWTLQTALMGAVTFAVPLMAILGIHELGHYYAAKRHGISASLPYFIPSIPPFGTFGAFISLREPMPDRKTLVDIGAAGPMCGFLVTIPVAILGLYLTGQGGVVAGDISAGAAYVTIQPIYNLMAYFFPSVDGLVMHPTAFAAWVGFFVTAINLLPVGQLDGGHIARGLFGDKAKYLGYAAFLVLFICALLYDGWLLFALLVILLGITHPAPLDNMSKIDNKTKAFGAITLLLILITFVPEPLHVAEADYSFNVENVQYPENSIVFELVNTGNTGYDVEISLSEKVEYKIWADGIEVDGKLHIDRESSKEIRVEAYPDDPEIKKVTVYLHSPGDEDIQIFNLAS